MKVASRHGTDDAGMHGAVGIDGVALQNYAMPVRAGELGLEAPDRRNFTSFKLKRVTGYRSSQVSTKANVAICQLRPTLNGFEL